MTQPLPARPVATGVYDRRQNDRLTVEWAAEVTTEWGLQMPAICCDLSERGAGIVTSLATGPDEQVTLTVYAPQGPMELAGHVAWTRPGQRHRAGIALDPLDPPTQRWLRRILPRDRG